MVGARPNFVKLAPVYHALAAISNVDQTVVHTGQHYDDNMSSLLLSQLKMPAPDVNLGIGSGTHAEQTGGVMIGLEPVLAKRMPDWLMVYGDVNSTLAATLVASKLGIKIAHVEAGLRSFDRSMPEEINRIVTDRLSDLLFTHSPEAETNLISEGISKDKIHQVGNVMVDSLVKLLPEAKRTAKPFITKYSDRPITLVTFHRGALTGRAERVRGLLDSLKRISSVSNVVFPVHPGTAAEIERHGLKDQLEFLEITPPLGYLEFLGIQTAASLVITDSGGVQEETSFLGTPCLTVRENTERPVTITQGSNRLVGYDFELLATLAMELVEKSVAGDSPVRPIIPLWDGHSGERVAEIILSTQSHERTRITASD